MLRKFSITFNVEKKIGTFVIMRTELIFALFVILSIVFFSSENNKDQVKVETLASQTLIVECIVPVFSFTKNNMPVSNQGFFQLIIKKYFEDTVCQKLKFAIASNKCHMIKAIEIIPLKQKPFWHIVQYTSEKQDDSDLS